MLSSEIYKKLNYEIVQNKSEQITLSEELKNEIEKEITFKYRQYLKTLVNDSEEIDIRNNRDLKITILIKSFFGTISNMKQFGKSYAEQIYQALLNFQKNIKEYLNEIKIKFQDEVDKTQFENFEEKLNCINNFINIMNNNINIYLKEGINSLKNEMDERKTKEIEEIKKL